MRRNIISQLEGVRLDDLPEVRAVADAGLTARFLRAMAPDEFNGEVDKINGSIVEVRFYCGALLAKRIKDVELKLNGTARSDSHAAVLVVLTVTKMRTR